MADTLIKLAERCEAATEASKELDRAIFDAVTGGVFGPSNARFWHSTSMTSRAANSFTASLDAAITLVPDGREWKIERRFSKAMSPAYASIWGVGARDIDHHDNAVGKSPALALCAAALRAKAA